MKTCETTKGKTMPTFQVRMKKSLYDRINDAANENDNSRNGEITYRLQSSFEINNAIDRTLEGVFGGRAGLRLARAICEAKDEAEIKTGLSSESDYVTWLIARAAIIYVINMLQPEKPQRVQDQEQRVQTELMQRFHSAGPETLKGFLDVMAGAPISPAQEALLDGNEIGRRVARLFLAVASDPTTAAAESDIHV